MTGKEIEEIRKRVGLSRKAMANQIGCDPQTLYRWEREGRRPSGMALERLITFKDSVEHTTVKIDKSKSGILVFVEEKVAIIASEIKSIVLHYEAEDTICILTKQETDEPYYVKADFDDTIKRWGEALDDD